MKKALVILFLSASVAHAGLEKSPTEMYDMTKRMADKVTVKIETVSNIQATCESESRRRNFGGFGYGVEACTFWDKGFTGHSCTIFIGKKTNNDILGHELRHCFVGDFH